MTINGKLEIYKSIYTLGPLNFIPSIKCNTFKVSYFYIHLINYDNITKFKTALERQPENRV